MITAPPPAGRDVSDDHPVGQCLAVHNPLTGAVSLLNSDAARYWWMRRSLGDAWIASLSNSETTTARRLVADWASAGLIGELPAGSAPADPLPRPAGSWPRGMQHPPLLDACFGPPLAATRIVSTDACLAELLDAALKPLALANPAEEPRVACQLTIAPAEHDPARVIYAETGMKPLVTGRADARRRALRAVLLGAASPGAVSAILHGALVRTGSDAILIAGESGAGKTTLALSLVAAGAELLADDLVALDGSGRCGTGLPTAVSIKEGSWPLAASLFPELLEAPVLALGSRRVRYLPLAKAHWFRQPPVAISRILFPRYCVGAGVCEQMLTPEGVFATLIATGSLIEGTPKSIAGLAAFANRVPACAIRYGSFEAMAPTLAGLRRAA